MFVIGAQVNIYTPNMDNRVDAIKLNSPNPPLYYSGFFFANFIQTSTCGFLSRRTLQAWHNLNPQRCSVLHMVILVTVAPSALRSSTSSCHAVMCCSLNFFLIRFTQRWENLCGAPDRGRLIVNWCFFHFLNITQKVDSFTWLANRFVAHSSLVQVYSFFSGCPKTIRSSCLLGRA